jgi:hypothetical protein
MLQGKFATAVSVALFDEDAIGEIRNKFATAVSVALFDEDAIRPQ